MVTSKSSKSSKSVNSGAKEAAKVEAKTVLGSLAEQFVECGSEIPAGKSLTLDEERERDRELVKWGYAFDALKDCFARIDAETGISARELLEMIFEENGYPEFYASARLDEERLLGIDLVNN